MQLLETLGFSTVSLSFGIARDAASDTAERCHESSTPAAKTMMRDVKRKTSHMLCQGDTKCTYPLGTTDAIRAASL